MLSTMTGTRVCMPEKRQSTCHEQHLIDKWTERRLRKPSDQVTTEDIVTGIPHPQGLRYHPVAKSEMGGRLADHLHHVEEREAVERMALAERFLRDTDTAAAASAPLADASPAASAAVEH